MDGITGFNIHRGCLAVGERPRSRRWQEIATGARTMVALERVMNADNVGGVARNAATFGADAALLAPFARATPWPSALHALREQNVALRHEGEGLSAAAIEACDY
jgi:tRNA G18 (ribose-2'-O)-methylase SpoU